VDCHERMRELGSTLRRVREVVGLSQERLAKLAGVSQGAVSRLEAGRGLATPFLVVTKIHTALDKALADVEPEALSNDLRLRFDPERFWSSGEEATEQGAEAAASADYDFEDLVVRYRHLPPTKRTTFLAIIRAALGALE